MSALRRLLDHRTGILCAGPDVLGQAQFRKPIGPGNCADAPSIRSTAMRGTPTRPALWSMFVRCAPSPEFTHWIRLDAS
jgi:hypothetical protein